MQRDLESILITRAAIDARVEALGRAIIADMEQAAGERELVIVPILTGSIIFVADLIRHLPVKLRLELAGVTSYPGTSMESKGAAMRHDLPRSLGDKHVLVVDDILDSGQTLDLVTRLIGEQKPASLRTCVLLRKPGKAKVAFKPDYVGFDIPDEFVVGYGLDYDGYYRNYPEIATLKPEAR